MNPFYILCAALFFIPLVGSTVLAPVIPALIDLKSSKEFFCLFSALLIFIFTFINGHTRHDVRNNKFLHILVVYIIFSIFSAPPVKLLYYYDNLGGLWQWESFVWVIAYYLLYLSIIRMSVVREIHEKLISKCIAWAAIASSIYAWFQFFNLDQFQVVKTVEQIGGVDMPNITAMIGNPTYLALFLTICLPFCCFYKGWWWTVLVCSAILICKSDIALAGAILTLLFIACMSSGIKYLIRGLVCLIIIAIMCLWAFWGEIRPHLHDNGRFQVWEQTFEDWHSAPFQQEIDPAMSPAQKAEVQKLNKKTYQLTGFGIGSYPYLFSPKYTTRFQNPHNEYLLVLYTIGLLGLALFLFAVFFVLRNTFIIAGTNIFALALYSSFLFIIFAMFAEPILHIEPLRFFSAVIFSLLSSLIPRRQEQE